jgi:hypothetical protein
MDYSETAEFFYWLAAAIATVGVGAGFFLTIKEYSKSATVSADTTYATSLGLIVFVIGLAVRHYFAGL